MRSYYRILLTLVLWPLTGPVAQAQDTCALTVVARGVRNAEGSVGAIVFASKAGWPKEHDLAFRSRGVPAHAGDVELVFDSIPPGEYGIVATHDENGNKELDCSPSGRPLEGWGMSNDPKARFKAPGFSKALVQVGCGDRIEIRIQYRKKKGDKNDK